MSATIGELVVNLKASTAQFSSDLKEASNKTHSAMSEIKASVDDLGESFKRLGELAGVASLGEFVKNSVEYAHQIGNLSKVIGDSVEQTSRLAYAAQQADIGVDQLSRTMGALSRAVLNAQTGNKRDAALFQFLGVDDVKNIGSTSDLLLKLVDSFNQLPPSIDRTSVATALFSRTGVDMIPFLTTSTEELKKLMAQSDATGSTVTKAQAEMSEKLQNAYNQITASAKAFTVELVEKLSPGILDSAKNFSTWEERIGGVRAEADKFADVIQKIGGALDELSGKGGKSGIPWLDDLAKKYPFIFGGQPLPQFKIGDTLPGAPAGTASLFNLSQLDQPKFAPQAPQPPAPPKTPYNVGSDLVDLFDKSTDAGKRYQAMLEALDPEHRKLQLAISEITARLNAEISGMKSTTAATDEQRLATLGATAAQIADIDAKERWAQVVQSARNIAVQTAQDFQKLNELQRTQTANLQTAVNLQNAIKDINAAAAGANNPLGPVIGDNAQQQASKMDVLVKNVTNSLKGQLDLLRATPDQYALMTAGIEHADAASQQQYLDVVHQIRKTQELAHEWQNFGRDAYTALDGLIFQGKSFGDVVANLAKQIGEMALQWTLFGQSGNGGFLSVIGKSLGFLSKGVSFAPGISASDIPGLATGGPALANRPYVVGENGPELFVPGSSGSIVPNGGWKGSGGDTYVTNNYVDARGAQVGFAQQIAAALKQTEDRAVNRSVKQVADMRLRTA